jgi:hypothetical protein
MVLRRRTMAMAAGLACGAVLLSACDSEPTGAPPTRAVHVPNQATVTPTGNAAVKWSIGPILATFEQACFCTTYVVDYTVANGLDTNDIWRFTWTLSLAVVPGDTGLGDPGTTGSVAGVDSGCTNAGKGVSSPVVDELHLKAYSRDEFTWVHPDPHVIEPYACNHTLQGPHGHEGIIKVSVVHGAQTCTAAYYGTHSGSSTDAEPADHAQPGASTCSTT